MRRHAGLAECHGNTDESCIVFESLVVASWPHTSFPRRLVFLLTCLSRPAAEYTNYNNPLGPSVASSLSTISVFCNLKKQTLHEVFLFLKTILPKCYFCRSKKDDIHLVSHESSMGHRYLAAPWLCVLSTNPCIRMLRSMV